MGLSIPNAFNAMQMSIGEQYLEHIDRKVKSGNYPSPDAVMAKALTLLDEHDESLAEEMDDVQGRVREGMEALRKGGYSEFTDETLHKLFDDVRSRGIKGRGSRNA